MRKSSVGSFLLTTSIECVVCMTHNFVSNVGQTHRTSCWFVYSYVNLTDGTVCGAATPIIPFVRDRTTDSHAGICLIVVIRLS